MDILSAFAVLDPKGVIALGERELMVNAVFFMLIVAVPVYVLLFFFAWRYRAGNKKARYAPNWEHGKLDELIWWAVPFEIVLVLGALTWTSTHRLDPRAPLEGGAPLVVQVVALDWKWLFIYPEEHIATVNYAQIPVGRPVRFDITADAPMNSFWVPELGGQIYAMTGMVAPLNLMASEEGFFEGGSANYSGPGFAHMKFAVEAAPEGEFERWAAGVRASSKTLDQRAYEELARPTVAEKPAYYARVDEGLYSGIVGKFMPMPMHHEHSHE